MQPPRPRPRAPAADVLNAGCAKMHLNDLPHDVLLLIGSHMHTDALHAMSQLSPFWHRTVHTELWPSRIASILSVRKVRFQTPQQRNPIHHPALCPLPTSSHTWHAIVHTFRTYPSSRCLHLCIQLAANDSITALALRYAVSVHDILRANALFAEHQLACRTHLYVPLRTDEHLVKLTGVPRARQQPFLISDVTLSSKYFLVVDVRTSDDNVVTPPPRRCLRHVFIRQLVAKFMTMGLVVHEDEIRYYLQDNHYNVGNAYKQLLTDHQFGARPP
ncbi:hypothetical protein BWQ96_00755 [Gracilariopsis chorda]|uniref:LysM domain-containing protein n=1 Tax=Gracilariopsis chorda TaxID=448386 RepID=A0A2V3J4W8_9FLOR|nr:hypothetical protein BWQ96_00755 [Gracilariopsis chorda]|eukprot:PXF49439.1 hypothetical protein BWQ96_00755 [Gracilariopsis chorda]